ncbi:MAG: flagellar basal body L-ring protein FlgH [Pseudomonadota bacterium]
MKRLGVLLSLCVLSACASRKDVSIVDQSEVLENRQTQPHQAATASLWNQAPESLFGNRRARSVGDILTVIVEINEEAEIDNEVDRSRSTSEVFSVRSLFGGSEYAANVLPGGATLEPGVDFNRDRSFSGNGSIRREDRITLRLAAKVVDKLPNGYLVIEGEQSVRVNHDERILRAAGTVRPEDISRSNTIAHDRIADAQIGYVGRGAIDRTIKPRKGNRLLDIIIPF